MASPNGTSCSAKSDKEEPPVSQEVKPSSRSAAVMSMIASVRALTPVSILGLMLDAPSMNGCTLVMKEDKSAPICGNELETPLINPPTIPPTNPPIAVPMVWRSWPPSLISHSSPGIRASPPTAARTIANSVITAPIPRTPTMAAGTSPATRPRAPTRAVNRPTAPIPLIRLSASILLNALRTPAKNAPTTSIAA